MNTFSMLPIDCLIRAHDVNKHVQMIKDRSHLADQIIRHVIKPTAGHKKDDFGLASNDIYSKTNFMKIVQPYSSYYMRIFGQQWR